MLEHIHLLTVLQITVCPPQSSFSSSERYQMREELLWVKNLPEQSSYSTASIQPPFFSQVQETFNIKTKRFSLALGLLWHVSHICVQKPFRHSYGLPAVTLNSSITSHIQSLLSVSHLTVKAGGALSHLSQLGCLCRG